MVRSQHEQVRNLIRDTILEIRDDVQFAYAEKQAINSKEKSYPFVLLLPMNQDLGVTEENENYTKTHRVQLCFYMPDQLEGSEEDTAKILDDMDLLSDTFMIKIMHSLVDEDYDPNSVTVSMSLVNRPRKTYFVKVLADLLTGWLLEFDLTITDNFNYEEAYDTTE